MNHKKVKKLFFEHYEKLNHKWTPDVSLIPPESDTSTLFINSGMQPLKPLFLGKEKPAAKRLFNLQKCVRTGDIEEVGDNKHLTLFFMLGNWSVGDYGATDAAQFGYDLLVNKYKMDKTKLWTTVFKGDKKLGIPKDVVMEKAWPKIGIPKERIDLQGTEDLLWISGKDGPCGPTSEFHYDYGSTVGCGKKNCTPSCDCGRFTEIWNACVQIRYMLHDGKRVTPLKLQSIDGGAGFERIVAVLQGTFDVYETSCLKPLVQQIEKLSGKKYGSNKKAMRIIADHVRASVFIAGEGITPAKKDKGYVLRRLIRRMVKYANPLGLVKMDISKLAGYVINEFKVDYPYLMRRQRNIHNIIENEYDKFSKTIVNGTRKLNKLMSSLKTKTIQGIEVFHLYDTFGFPMELTREIAAEKGFKIDEKGYHAQFEKHKQVSKQGQTKKFASGLADHSEQVVRYHTAAHLLLAALQKVLGSKVMQRGSNITGERIRFDFNWDGAMTGEQKKKTEDLVNKWISEKIPVTMKEMSMDDAKKAGAQGAFEHKYGTKVRVYTIGKVSKEICSGPHVKNTGEIGKFRIKKEKSSSAGVRRIKAFLE
jgi:alanyl-tRNA synthetase